jgi:hypothetical protein
MTTTTVDVRNRYGVPTARIIRTDSEDGLLSHVMLEDLLGGVDLDPDLAEQLQRWFMGVQTIGVWHPSMHRHGSVFIGGGPFGEVGPVPRDVVDAALPALLELARRAVSHTPPLDEVDV